MLVAPATALLSFTVVSQEGGLMASTKTGAGLLATVALTLVVLAIVAVTAAPKAWADDSEAQALKQVQRELRQLRADRARDRKLIEKLEQKLDQVESQDSQVRTTNQQLQNSNQQLQTKTDEELKQIQAQVAAGPTQSQIARWLGGYWGSHQFTIAGAGAAAFIYDRKLDQNTFAVNFNPEMFFRLNDWILFQGSLDASWNPGSSGASFSSGVADAQIFLNDYMEVVLGAFDQPFDDFYEDLGVLGQPFHHRAAALWSEGDGAAVRYRDAVSRSVSVGSVRAGRRLHGLGSQRAEL
jgi:hypothetical protein